MLVVGVTDTFGRTLGRLLVNVTRSSGVAVTWDFEEIEVVPNSSRFDSPAARAKEAAVTTPLAAAWVGYVVAGACPAGAWFDGRCTTVGVSVDNVLPRYMCSGAPWEIGCVARPRRECAPVSR